MHLGQLGHTVHQVGHAAAETLGHIVIGGVGVLHGVVEQGGDDGVGVQLQFRGDLGHGQRMGDIGGAVLAHLPGVGIVGIGEGVIEPLGIHPGIVGFDLILQRLIPL